MTLPQVNSNMTNLLVIALLVAILIVGLYQLRATYRADVTAAAAALNAAEELVPTRKSDYASLVRDATRRVDCLEQENAAMQGEIAGSAARRIPEKDVMSSTDKELQSLYNNPAVVYAMNLLEDLGVNGAIYDELVNYRWHPDNVDGL